MFKVVAVAPPIGDPSLYHWFPAPALLVKTIAAVPSQTVSGPTGLIVGAEVSFLLGLALLGREAWGRIKAAFRKKG